MLIFFYKCVCSFLMILLWNFAKFIFWTAWPKERERRNNTLAAQLLSLLINQKVLKACDDKIVPTFVFTVWSLTAPATLLLPLMCLATWLLSCVDVTPISSVVCSLRVLWTIPGKEGRLRINLATKLILQSIGTQLCSNIAIKKLSQERESYTRIMVYNGHLLTTTLKTPDVFEIF